MEVDIKTKDLIIRTVAAWQPQATVQGVIPISSDASPRRYYHIKIVPPSGLKVDSIVAMIFDSLVSPDSGQAAKVNANEATHKMTNYLIQNGYPVPDLYWGKEDDLIFLIEDLGETLLADVIIGPKAKCYTCDQIYLWYREASQLILQFQKLPHLSGFFPFERGFNGSTYIKEMNEFRDYVFKKCSPTENDISLLEQLFEVLAAELDQLPKVLAHRDFHSWNLMIDGFAHVRVIDYQDALMATSCYDFVPLINDRDTDGYLGPELYKKLLSAYWQDTGRGDDFIWEYYRVLLQRDLKVAGRFNKLNIDRKLSGYLQWVPGTLRRIGRSLRGINNTGNVNAIYQKITTVLLRSVKEIKEGYEDNTFIIN